jgi:tRNA(Arg) A34 adenosine deaminase TadA
LAPSSSSTIGSFPKHSTSRSGSLDPTAHAEVLVLREAARALGNYRLTDATVYVTIETVSDVRRPRFVHARVREVVYGAVEPKTGALVSTVRALEQPGLNHRFAVTGGVLELWSVVRSFKNSSGRGVVPNA